MQTQCDVLIDIATFEEALAPILPHSLSAIRAIALLPEGENLRVEIRTKSLRASVVLPKRGAWNACVVTRGDTVARLRGKFGTGELKLGYAAGRLTLNRLSLPASEEAPPAPDDRRAFRIDPPGPYCDVAVLHGFLQSLEKMPQDDPAVISLKLEYEAYIAERKRLAH